MTAVEPNSSHGRTQRLPAAALRDLRDGGCYSAMAEPARPSPR
ncbi:MAG: hypothetical protein ACK46L_11895 [Synechococcaceae cyanobacterium]